MNLSLLFVILFSLGSLGAKLMNVNNVIVQRQFILLVQLLDLGSFDFFAFCFFIKGCKDTFIYLGGLI